MVLRNACVPPEALCSAIGPAPLGTAVGEAHLPDLAPAPHSVLEANGQLYLALQTFPASFATFCNFHMSLPTE